MRWKLHVTLGLCLLFVGCFSSRADQASFFPHGWPTATQSAAEVDEGGDTAIHSTAEMLSVQQSGQANITADLRAEMTAALARADKLEAELTALKMQVGGDWKGFEYTTAVPIGQVALMCLMLFFSHRREVLRIKRERSA